MSDTKFDEMSPMKYGLPQGAELLNATPTQEYRVGHNKPPLFLIVLYVLVIIWCGISWIPFAGY